jgi:hypothetical protein
MLEIESFVFGSHVRISFEMSGVPSGTSFSGKLQRSGQTYNLSNTTEGTTLTMSSATNTLEAGKYKFVLLWYTIATNEPIEELEADLIIKPRK